MKLSQLTLNQTAYVTGVNDLTQNDRVSKRLSELGFVPDEPIALIGRGFWGMGPLLVAIGNTRFALRLAEADRIEVRETL